MTEADANEAIYTRPEGMTDKQEEIIQYAAKYVVASCDSAKYQQRLRAKTKYNPYFGFLDPKHAYHSHYDYLLRSYRYWMEQPGAGQQQQQFLSPEEDELGAHANSGGGGGYNAGYYSGSGYDASSYYHQQQQHQAGNSYSSAGGNGGGYYQQQQQQRGGSTTANAYIPDIDPTAAPQEYPSSLTPAKGHFSNGAEDEEEEYEMVVQNGVQTLVPKRR